MAKRKQISTAAPLDRDKRARLWGIWGWGVHTVIFVTLGLVLLRVVPRFERMFRELEVDLPATTMLVISAAHSTVRWWWFMLLVLVLGNGALWYLLPRKQPGMAWVWLLTGVVIGFLAGVYIFLGLFIPLARLPSELSP